MFDQRLRKAEIHLTYRCDLDCPGCNRGCFNKHNLPPDLSTETFIGILRQIQQEGFSRELVFIGGEPTLHPQCIEFMEIGHEIGFAQVLWSNAHSERAKNVLSEVRRLGLGRIAEGTHKLNGAVPGFHNPHIFCSPADMGVTRQPCKWGTDGYSWGYSADEQGFTPCPIGTAIAHYTAPSAIAGDLSLLTHKWYMLQIYERLCRHCGSFFTLDDSWERADKSQISEVKGTLMTETWRRIFNV